MELSGEKNNNKINGTTYPVYRDPVFAPLYHEGLSCV
jgi:hypothetical protein